VPDDAVRGAAVTSVAATAERAAPRRADQRPDDGALHRRYFATRDRSLRDQLVERYMPLARSLAHRYGRNREPLADLEQVAYLALIKAVEGYDPHRGAAFSSYAVPYIVGAIKHHFRDCGWALHVPRGPKDLSAKIQSLSREISDSTGRVPSAAELAERAGISVEEVLEARVAGQALHATSLELARDEEEPGGASVLDRLGAEDPRLDQALDRCAVDSALGLLDDRKRRVVQLYFRAELTQLEIGRHLGYSQMHVSRLLRQALAELHAVEHA
jgi:RNA polymerase sigma-B factor